MPNTVSSLTEAHHSSFTPFVRAWIAGATDCTPLDDAGRAAVVDGIRRCYEAAGLPWHDTVVWVGSPFVGMAVAWQVDAARQPVPPPPPPPRRRSRGEVARSGMSAGAWGAMGAAVLAAAAAFTWSAVGAYVGVAGGPAIAGAVLVGGFSVVAVLGSLFRDDGPSLGALLFGVLGIALFTVAGAGIGAQLGAGLTGWRFWIGPALWAASWWGLGGIVAGGVLGVTGGVRWAVRNPVPDPSPRPVHAHVPDPTAARIRAAVPMAVRAAVGDVVTSKVLDTVDRRAHEPVRDALRGLDTAVEHVVGGRLGDWDMPEAVNERLLATTAADLVARLAPERAGGAVTSTPLTRGREALFRVPHVAGASAASLLAGPMWLREHTGLALPGDRWELADAYLAAGGAGWWWPFADLVIISERPLSMTLEDADTDAPRVHREDGPALVWSDGFAAWCMHGRAVDPPDRPYATVLAGL
jgi:hypothetical protein